jgi:HAD superfamily hydrolase (TIGR01509 family)
MDLKKTIKAIVFDMDGVLIDAREWHYKALNEALEIFNVSINLQEHNDRFDGLPTSVKLNILSSEGRIPRHLHQIINDIKQERTLRVAAELCFPNIEHLIMMDWLRQKEVKIGLATNSIRKTTTTFLQYAGLLEYFHTIVTNEDVTNAKPSPEIYLKASKEMNYSPNQILAIEDSEYGLKSASDAGFNVIKVAGPFDVNENLLREYFEQ